MGEKGEKLKFRMICTGGPNGDCSYNYDVEIQGKCTVGRFVESVLEEMPGEWGEFEIVTNLKYPYQNKVDGCEYSKGKIKKNFRKKRDRGAGSRKSGSEWRLVADEFSCQSKSIEDPGRIAGAFSMLY